MDPLRSGGRVLAGVGGSDLVGLVNEVGDSGDVATRVGPHPDWVPGSSYWVT
jgi:hypothetical protein